MPLKALRDVHAQGDYNWSQQGDSRWHCLGVMSKTKLLSDGAVTGHLLTKSISLAVEPRWTLQSYQAKRGPCCSNTSRGRTAALQFKGKHCTGDQSKAEAVCAHTHTQASASLAHTAHDNACIISVAHSQTQTSTNRASGSGCARPWH